MYFSDLFSTLPLLAIYGLSILLVLVSLGLGYLFGHRRDRREDPSIGSAVAATLGLLAFMLAFTFNMTAERFSQRKALLLEEANAISTAYLRADFLNAEGKRDARALLAEYARVRDFNPSEISMEEYEAGLRRSMEIHRELWQLVEQHIAAGYDTGKLRAFYEPLNAVIDYNTRRIFVGSRYQIPPAIWIALYAITALAMFGIGFQLGASRRGSLQVAVALALAFSLVILLIADLDRSGQGFLVVDQTAMKEVAEILQAAEEAASQEAGKH